MSLWVVIPVKPLNRAKSRLADVLSAKSRYHFAETMLRNTLQVIAQVPQITGTLVISRDTKALSIARELGARTIQESNPSDLNPALRRATEVIKMWGAGALLILPADLPFIHADDIAILAELGIYENTIVLSPDTYRDGTNAMLIRPPGLIDYHYGAGSFAIHIEKAHAVGATVRIHEAESLALDIDIPADLSAYNRCLASGNYDYLPPFEPDSTFE